MAIKRLKLVELKVQSFVTSIGEGDSETIKGGSVINCFVSGVRCGPDPDTKANCTVATCPPQPSDACPQPSDGCTQNTCPTDVNCNTLEQTCGSFG